MRCKCGEEMYLEEYEDMYISEYYYYKCAKCKRSLGMTTHIKGDCFHEWSDD